MTEAARTLRAELRVLDAVLAERRFAVWIGAEPTFTDAASLDPPWLCEVEGGDKEARARALVAALAPRLSGRVRFARLHGRHFPGEASPRFCMGAIVDAAVPPAPRPAVEPCALDGPPVPAPAPAEREALFTVTPDPGVVEVNTAPAPDLDTFHAWGEAIYAAAAEVGLSPVRWRFDGHEADSGGGGQLTLGGPTPEASPFLLHPQLLPRLVRYLANHPSLSYAFAGECVGSASQGPRTDEGVRERFEELAVALDRLERRGAHLTAAELWGTLAPLLVDASGNSHRAEVNVEKLWNPFLPGRGRLGLVELRAFRMQPDADRQAALAALLLAVAARLAARSYREPVADWGASLHDRFALPTVLQEDLRAVLADLEENGLGLGQATRALLLARPEPLVEAGLAGATLTVTPALEFWPLVGDVASQERAASRIVDASTRRVELVVSHPRGADPGRVAAGGWVVPLRADGDRRHLAAVRWRAFAPRPGLHPGLPALDPLVLHWEREGQRVAIELHGWIPGGGSYPGLPADAAEARRRRAARVRTTASAPFSARPPPPIAGYTLDLRTLDALRADLPRPPDAA